MAGEAVRMRDGAYTMRGCVVPENCANFVISSSEPVL